VRVSYFTEEVPGDGSVRLAAAVAWHGEPLRERAALRAPGPLGWLRRRRHRLWLKYGTMGIDLHLRSSTRRSGGATFGQDGEDATYFDAVRRDVTVLGRRYPMPPDGRALVLLVDYGRSAEDGPRVGVRSVPTAVRPSRREELFAAPDSEEEAARRAAAMNADQEAWTAAIRSDPEVRAFLDQDSQG
jgi:hypothetical protein